MGIFVPLGLPGVAWHTRVIAIGSCSSYYRILASVPCRRDSGRRRERLIVNRVRLRRNESVSCAHRVELRLRRPRLISRRVGRCPSRCCEGLEAKYGEVNIFRDRGGMIS